MRKEIDINFNWSTVQGSTENHNKFKKQFIKVVNKTFLKSMVIPYDIGFVRAYSQPEICYKIGQDGVLDTIVIIPNHVLFFDMKTGNARLSTLQKAFIKQVKLINGVDKAFKINSIKEGLDIIKGFYEDNG